MAAEAAKATTKTGVIEPVATMPTAAAAVTPVSAVKPAPAGAVTPAPIVPPVPAAAAVKPAPIVPPVPAVAAVKPAPIVPPVPAAAAVKPAPAAAAVKPAPVVPPAPAVAAVKPAPVVPPVPAAAAVKPAPAAAVKPVPAVTSAAGQARLDEIKGKLLKFIGKFTGQKEKLTESGQEGAAKPELPSVKAATAASKELAKQERQELMDAKRIYEEGLASIKDLIAPSSLEVTIEDLNIDGLYANTIYVYAYPRYMETNWLSPVINFDVTLDISMFIYPIESMHILKVLKTKVGQMTSTIRMQE